MKDMEPTFTKGSRYRIMSKGPNDDFLVTVGEFKGYTTFGNGTAVRMEIDPESGQEGIRIIPLMVIFAIDVIETKEPEEEDTEATRVYFG
jgi:hypothetical protein